MRKVITACQCSVLALALVASHAVYAQTAPADDAAAEAAPVSDEQEIIVTAQRREERMQDIPVAISAFGAKQLDRLGVSSIENIAPRVPSFYFGSFGALRPQLYIRGIGTRSFDPGSESSVGVFQDEVYLGRSSGSFGAIKDVERIEVLRGPQGTLYGRNTIGGAINVITKGPTDVFSAQVEGGISNYDGYELFGAVGGPIAGDKIMFRAAAWKTERDGYVTNLKTGTKLQGVDNQGARLRLAFVPVEALRIDLTAEITHDGDKGAFGGFNQGTFGNPSTVFFKGGTAVPTTNTGDLRQGFLSSDPILDRDTRALIGKIDYDLVAASLTSISSYRELRVADSRDLEGSSLDVIDQLSHERSNQYTQEFRLTSTPGEGLSFGGALDWIVGAFYYSDKSFREDDFRVGVNSAVRAASGIATTDIVTSDYKIESYAFFGQATVHLGEKFDVTVGGRYSHDKKRATQTGATTDALPLVATSFSTTNGATYTSFDPRIVATWKFSRDANIYASYSTGFKSGGFQYVPFTRAQANVLFKPEDIKAYEVGFKTEWLNNALRVNGAFYEYKYKNLQVSRIIDAGGAPVTLITNAASSTIKGADLEVLARPSRNFEVSITYGYLDAKYDKYIFNATTDFSGTRLVRAPKHSVSTGAEWRIPVGDKDQLTLRADYALLSDFFHEPGQGEIRFGTGIPLTAEDGYGLLDLRATWQHGPFRLTGYVNNATGTKYRRTINALGSTVVGFAGAPRLYGLKVGFTY